MDLVVGSFERRAVASLSVLYAFRMLGLFMVLPVLALYGEGYAGSTPLLIGMALGGYGLAQALLQLPFGLLSDRWGRKPVIAIGLLLFALGSVVAAMADDVYWLIVGRCLQGAGAIASTIMALVADVTAEENRTKAMAAIGASIGLSFSIALVLGPVVASVAGISAIFWLTALFALLGLVILFRWVPTPRRGLVTHREAGAVLGLFRPTLKNIELLRLNFGIFTLHFVLMASFVVLPVVLESQLGVAREQHWLIYLPLLLLAFAVMIPFIVVAEKRRQMKPVFVAAIVLLAGVELMLVWWQHQLVLALLAIFLFFVAFNLLEATLPSLVSKLSPAGSKGTAAGIYSTCQFLGAFAGGVAGGWVIDRGEPADVFIGCALLVACWAIVAVVMRSPRHLTSVLVRLAAEDFSRMEPRLLALPGVEEVVLIEEEGAAYLKVDADDFDRASVAALS